MFLESHTQKQPKWAGCSSRRKSWRQHLFVIVSIWQRQEMKEWNEPQLWIPSSVFCNPKSSRLGREGFLLPTVSSREEDRSLQLPQPPPSRKSFQRELPPGKKQDPTGQYLFIVLYPVNLPSFANLRVKKYLVLVCLDYLQAIVSVFFISVLVAQHLWSRWTGFIPRPSLIINVLITG